MMREREKKEENLKSGRKIITQNKSTEKLVGEPYNYQGNGDMGNPLTQERKREMLDLPKKHS